MNQHVDTVIFIIALVVFVIFRRVRRNIGWQSLNPRRLRTRAFIFFIIGVIFFDLGAAKPVTLISDVAGIVIGFVLAYYSRLPHAV